MWVPPWKDEGWDARFGESWRRLMVRTAVAHELIVNAESLAEDSAFELHLEDVVIAATQSASVARVVLEKNVRLETRGLMETAVSAW